ncbi:MAG TPA: hypothetical protein VK622_05860 [Puia sp.]|nr:hypothetical protein [Puia sp.]
MTRTLLILVLFISSSLIVNAQFKKNDILLGGQLSYNYNSSSTTQPTALYPNSDQKVNSGNFVISLGKALNDNTVIGIDLSYQPSTTTNYQNFGPTLLKYKDNGYAVGVFFRKYKSLGKDFYLFGQGTASYDWSNQTGADSTGLKRITGSSWGAAIQVYPGIAYRISKHFFLEVSIPDLFIASYEKRNLVNQYGTVNEVQTSKNDGFYISSSLSSNPFESLGIGFRLIL